MRRASRGIGRYLVAGCLVAGLLPTAAGATGASGVDRAAQLSRTWSASAGAPVQVLASGDTLLAVTETRVEGYEVTAGRACDPARVCSPRWTAPVPLAATGPATVGPGRLYVPTARGVVVYALDPSHCSLARPVCRPLFVGPTPGPVRTRPALAGPFVVVGQDDGTLFAFDAQGLVTCDLPGGACLPRWTAPGRGTGPVALGASGSTLAVADPNGLAVYDVSDAARCPEGSRACRPVWVASVATPALAPAVDPGTVAVTTSTGLDVYEPSGGSSCTTAPVPDCAPRARIEWPAPLGAPGLSAPGTILVGSDAGEVLAFAGTAISTCDGTCAPDWQAHLGAPVAAAPAVVDGVVYVRTTGGSIAALDPAGANRCQGAPATCRPLWVGSGLIGAEAPVAAGGSLATGTLDGRIVVLRDVVRPADLAHRGRALTADAQDRFDEVTAGDVTTYTGGPENVGGNTRFAVTDTGTPRTLDHEACATWTAQTDWTNQEGVALRVRQVGADTTAITVTKNVWFGAAWIVNVHVWDTASDPSYRWIAGFDLSGVLAPGGTLHDLPWRLCARAVGDVVDLVAWPLDSPRPAYGDVTHGGSVLLPAGFARAGRPGWYVGHLRAGDAVTYRDLTTVDLTGAAAGARSTGATPRAPLRIPARP